MKRTELTDDKEKRLAKMGEKKWRDLMAKQNPDMSASVDWNIEAARSGKLPALIPAEESTPKNELGPLYFVGAVEGCKGKMRIIREYWDAGLPQGDYKTLWTLPEDAGGRHIAATSNMYHACHNSEIRNSAAVPRMRYDHETRINCEVATHANNMYQNQGEWIRDSSDGAAPSNGGNAAGSSSWRFEQDMSKASVGQFCVGVGIGTEKSDTERYVWVSKIKSLNMERKTLTVVDLQPSKDPWVRDNMKNMKWSPSRRAGAFFFVNAALLSPTNTHRLNQILCRADANEVKNENIICYMKKLNKGGVFDKKTCEAVCSHEMWNEKKLDDDDDVAARSRSREQDREQPDAVEDSEDGEDGELDENDSEATEEDSNEDATSDSD
jgi:hypothetical protein